jgi:hypothetical protein
MRQRLADPGLVKGEPVGIDATTLEANAALRRIVRRNSGGEATRDLHAVLVAMRLDKFVRPTNASGR